jgi:hypothetical protein
MLGQVGSRLMFGKALSTLFPGLGEDCACSGTQPGGRSGAGSIPCSNWDHQWERWLVLAIRLWSCHNLAEVIQALTRKQLVRHLSALPILVALLSRLKVRETINHYCPTHSPIDNGTVVLVLVLNRLMAPRSAGGWHPAHSTKWWIG